MTKEDRVVLNERELNIPVVAEKSKGAIRIDQPYTLIRERIFSLKGRCDLCENEKKAEGLIFIYDAAEDRTFTTGKFCLKEVFGITGSKLEKFTGRQVAVALRISTLTGQDYEDRTDMLTGLGRFLADHLIQHPEFEKCLRILNSLKDVEQLLDSHYEQVDRIIDFYLLIHEAVFQPDLYHDRITATVQDPGYEKVSRAQSVSIEGYQDVQKLTTNRAEILRKVMKSLSPKTYLAKLDNVNVIPWEYPDKESYLAALRSHYVALADQGAILGTGLQASYDYVYFNYDWDGYSRISYPQNMKTLAGFVRLPSVLPLVLHEQLKLDNWHKVASTLVEAEFKLQQGGMSRSHYHSAVVHQGMARGIRPEDRKSYENQVSTDDQIEVSYRCSTFWKPDRLFPVYRLWYKYQSQGGRDFLLTFPQSK